jgi:hypothetical protein
MEPIRLLILNRAKTPSPRVLPVSWRACQEYRQLSFVNEYGCVELERFVKEAKRFVKSRHLYDHLVWDPKDEIEQDAEEIVMLTSAWASMEEDNARSRFNHQCHPDNTSNIALTGSPSMVGMCG